MRIKKFRSKNLSIFLTATWLFFCSAYIIEAEPASAGNMVGFVFAGDGITPVAGAVVKLKNIRTAEEFTSLPTDELGVFRLSGLPEGVYVMGVEYEGGAFNVQNPVGIKAGTTAKISLALKPGVQQDEQKKKKKRGGLIAFLSSPAGIAVIIAASALIVYTVWTLTKEEEASPYR